MAKKPVTKKTEVEVAPEKLKTADQAEANTKTEPETETGKVKSVQVKNLTKTRFFQSSSDTAIWGGQTKPLNLDGWLQNQVDAGLLEIV